MKQSIANLEQMRDQLRNTLTSIAFMMVWIRVDVAPLSQTHFVLHTSRMHKHMYIDHMLSIYISMRICTNMARIQIRIHAHIWPMSIYVYMYTCG